MKRQPREGEPPGRADEVVRGDGTRATVRVYADAESLAAAAAAEFGRRARAAVGERGRFAVALSGGSTPGRTYALLALPRGPGGDVPWREVHVFWGDERIVPPDRPESNYRAADEALLSRVPIPARNVHRVPAERGKAAEVAALYEGELRRFFATPDGVPRFDLVLLGLGADGHTASLFPGSEALAERERLVVAPSAKELGTHRVSLTFPVLDNARAVAFLVSGEEKAAVLARALGGAGGDAPPAARVRPLDGELLFLVDRAAARGLPAPGR